MKWWDQMPSPLIFECWGLIQLFHSHFSPSSRGSLVPLCFLPLRWYQLHIWGCLCFSWQYLFQFVIHPAWHFSRCTLHRIKISRVTIYNLLEPAFPNLEPVDCFMPSFNCCFLTCIQVSQKTGKVVWYFHLLKNFSQSFCDPYSQRL